MSVSSPASPSEPSDRRPARRGPRTSLDELNHRPRKRLGYRTQEECYSR
jgi:hypothetical protein